MRTGSGVLSRSNQSLDRVIKLALVRVDGMGMFLLILVFASLLAALVGAWSLDESLAYRLLVAGSLLAMYALMLVPAFII